MHSFLLSQLLWRFQMLFGVEFLFWLISWTLYCFAIFFFWNGWSILQEWPPSFGPKLVAQRWRWLLVSANHSSRSAGWT
jgi:hypothetical protein